MHPLHIAICDDSNDDGILLEQLLEESSAPISCERFENGESLLSDFYPSKYDVIFMDIYMEGLLGVQTVEQIRQMDENILIAFTTTSPDHALESYRLGALKYIEKPVTKKAVRETLELALTRQKAAASMTFLIDGKKVAVILDSVIFFEQNDHTVIINMANGAVFTAWHIKLGEFEKQLPCQTFLRCHHSFIVNLKFVQSLDKELNLFHMKNGKVAHISRENFRKARDAINNYLFAAARGYLNAD